MTDGYFPGPNAPAPVLTAPDAVFVRVGLLEAVAEKAAEVTAWGWGLPATPGAITAHKELRAALAAAGATDQGDGET